MSLKNNYPTIMPSLAMDFVNCTVLSPLVTFSRSSIATRVNSIGLIETVGNNVPRFDYDPVTLAPKGLLIEESRTNLLTYSDQFDNAVWNKNASITISANSAIAPDGTQTADQFSGTLVNTGVWRVPTTVSGVQHVESVYIKNVADATNLLIGCDANPNNAFIRVNAVTGTITSTTANVQASSITSVGNGWYRVTVTFTTTTTLPTFVIYSTSGSLATWLVWGAQLEAGAFPTSYIPTTTAQVTRTADNASMTGTNFSSWYNQSEGTIYSEWVLGGDNTSVNVYNINDGTGSNYIRNRYNSAGSGNDNAVGVGGIVQVVLNAINQTTTYSSYKNAMSYKQSDFARSSSGTLITNASGNIPTVTQINLGSAVVFGAESLNGHIQSFKYYPQRLSNAQLQTLSK